MALKKSLYTHLGTAFWALAATFALLPSWPQLYYRLSPKASNQLATTLANTAVSPLSKGDQGGLKPTPSPSEGEGSGVRSKPTQPEVSLPPQDPSLPTQNGLIIDKIGVQGEIHEGEDWENILKKGLWRVPNFGTPDESLRSLGEGRPIIIAAHRWGYLEWSQSFRKLNSFYNLPKLKIGDKIDLIWDQRKYEYTVTSTETGTKITDYSANLILYTCQLWNSPIRFFVYATRTN